MAQTAQAVDRPNHSQGQPGARPPAHSKSVIREYAEAIIVALVLALFIRTFFVQAYKIPSGSMEPTLLVGDHILVNKLIYGLRLPDSLLGVQIPGIPWGHYLFDLEQVHRGDVVVFVFPPDPTKDFIKRVIAIPGDTVEVRDHAVFIDGNKVDDPHAHYEDNPMHAGSGGNLKPVKVPDHQYFVMGDNRDHSYDSRYWGFVDRDKIEGKALVIYWSWDSEGSGLFHIRWWRFGRLVG